MLPHFIRGHPRIFPLDFSLQISSQYEIDISSPTPAVAHPSTTSIGGNIIPSDDRGDFVESEDEGEIDKVSEYPNLYPEGLLYPICIGDMVADRYRIDHTLGHGSYSTVWMAQDVVNESDVALKIMALGESAESDRQIQDEIIQRVKDTTHRSYTRTRFSCLVLMAIIEFWFYPYKAPIFETTGTADQLPPVSRWLYSY